ncbi:hypothetical protein CYMTET_10452 [Cymbomonas tetramitiformis]|uniref:Uncharacterized protein n=1 Tax=Cymbomonas tetramitiformis TaxID=36881 RepID=A0AAE0GPC3_9CHLO|nr:hypothetical protein CYMTET_10452 [Cymbomonas tetramitiformis]
MNSSNLVLSTTYLHVESTERLLFWSRVPSSERIKKRRGSRFWQWPKEKQQPQELANDEEAAQGAHQLHDPGAHQPHDPGPSAPPHDPGPSAPSDSSLASPSPTSSPRSSGHSSQPSDAIQTNISFTQWQHSLPTNHEMTDVPPLENSGAYTEGQGKRNKYSYGWVKKQLYGGTNRIIKTLNRKTPPRSERDDMSDPFLGESSHRSHR